MCALALLGYVAVVVALLHVLVVVALHWWRNRRPPVWKRIVSLVPLLLLFPYSFLFYYWFVYERLGRRRECGDFGGGVPGPSS